MIYMILKFKKILKLHNFKIYALANTNFIGYG